MSRDGRLFMEIATIMHENRWPLFVDCRLFRTLCDIDMHQAELADLDAIYFSFHSS